MITAAVAGMQARKLNYVEVEIVPKPSTGKNGDRPFIHISDVGVQYSTIIFPERDEKGTPHNSIVDEDPLQLSCGSREFANHENSHEIPPDVPRRDNHPSEGKKKHVGTSTPPRRRRAHSSPNSPRSKKISSLEGCGQREVGNGDESYKTRTLPSSEYSWQDEVFVVEIPKNEDPVGRVPALERVERANQDTPTRKMKKFFRTGRHASDLGATQDILQAVQAMQKKVRRKSSGESVDSSNDREYPSNSHEFGSVGMENVMQQGGILTSVRNPPPIPGSMRSAELENVATRRKLSRQSSIDQKKMMLDRKEKSSQVASETKSKTKFLQMFPTMKFGKFGSSSKSKEAKQESKNPQLIKKPVPLPRYNKNYVSPPPSCSEGLDGVMEPTSPEVLCESRTRDGTERARVTESETYENVVFQQREGHGHNYENVNVEDKTSPDHLSKYFTKPDLNHHTRPLPAPRLNTPNQPIKDHKATPPDKNEISFNRKKQDMNSPRQTGYEPVSFKPPCLQLIDASFFPKQVGSSFEEDETTGSNDEYHSSFDEDAVSRKKEIELLSLTLKQDVSLSKEKRAKCDPLPKRNSDGSVRCVPDGWGTSEYAVFQKGEPEEVRSFHQKHVRAHSSGGQVMLYNGKFLHGGDGVTHVGEPVEVYHSADIFPNIKKDNFKSIQSSPPRPGREKRAPPRTTHEHITLGQHVHSNLHSGQPGGTSKEKELKSKYLDDVTCAQRNPQLGSPSTQGQSPWWDDNGEEEQLEEKPIPSYINQPWYYGKLLRQECDYLMMSKGKPCQYLVRDSSHRAGGLMLCVLFGQKVHHYIIHVLSNTEYQMAGHTFGSVSDIIDFYRKHVIMYSPNQEPVFLGEPFLYPR